jgi:hypothetical protein
MRHFVATLFLLAHFFAFFRVNAYFSLHDRLVLAAGSQEALDESFHYVSERATMLHGGMNNTFELVGSGKWGVVLRINFTDGESWAAKVSCTYSMFSSGHTVLGLIGRVCPWVRAPRVRSEMERFGDSQLWFYFTDWVEGTSWDASFSMIGVGLWESRLPDNLLSQLTDFIYNVTTCPLEPHEGMQHPPSNC